MPTSNSVYALYDNRIGDISSSLIFFVGVRRSMTSFSGVTRSMASIALFTNSSIKACALASVLGPLSPVMSYCGWRSHYSLLGMSLPFYYNIVANSFLFENFAGIFSTKNSDLVLYISVWKAFCIVSSIQVITITNSSVCK